MRIILSTALVLGAIFVNVMAAPSMTSHVSEMDATKNRVIVDGLYVALPSDMKNFSVELVPL
jgi:hypothetical protein